MHKKIKVLFVELLTGPVHGDFSDWPLFPDRPAEVIWLLTVVLGALVAIQGLVHYSCHWGRGDSPLDVCLTYIHYPVYILIALYDFLLVDSCLLVYTANLPKVWVVSHGFSESYPHST